MNVILGRKVFGWSLVTFSLTTFTPFFETYSPDIPSIVSLAGRLISVGLVLWLTFLILRPLLGKSYETFLDFITEFYTSLFKMYFPIKLNPDKTWLRLLVFFPLLTVILLLSFFYLPQVGLTSWEILFQFYLPLFWGTAILMKVWT